ncbi:hypothetical protein [Jannaschia marina]|uniref:hypothetical protein n=1 Tax=Jannaschia marina TaxID=2741674 RepID=UPI0015CCAAAC|nr:hypothetical protein [Jannaschia marina]
MTADHLIPRSLGGPDYALIRASKKANSIIGSRVEGRLAKDPSIQLARIRNNARGASGKKPFSIFRNAIRAEDYPKIANGNTEAIDKFTVHNYGSFGIAVQNQRSRAWLTRSECYQSAWLTTDFRLDYEARAAFLAKIALALPVYLLLLDISETQPTKILHRMLFGNFSLRPAAKETRVRFSHPWLGERDEIDPHGEDKISRFIPNKKYPSALISEGRKKTVLGCRVLGEYIGTLTWQPKRPPTKEQAYRVDFMDVSPEIVFLQDCPLQ